MKPVVLLIEPVLEDAERIAEHLARIGLYAAVAFDSAQAMALVRSVSPSLIIANQSLPEGSGFRLVASLARDPVAAGVAIVMIGRSADAATRGWAQRAGAVEYLSKQRADLNERLGELVLRHLSGRGADAVPRLDPALLGKIRGIVAELAEDPYLNDAGKCAVIVAEVAATSGFEQVRGSVLDWRGNVIEAEHEWLRGPDGTLIDPSVRRLWPRIKGWPGYDDVAVIARAMPLHAQYVTRS